MGVYEVPDHEKISLPVTAHGAWVHAADNEVVARCCSAQIAQEIAKLINRDATRLSGYAIGKCGA